MRLAFVSARSVSVVDGALWTDAGMGRLIDAIGERVSSMRLALSVRPDVEPMHDHRIRAGADDFTGLPWLPSVAGGFRRAPACLRAIRHVERDVDLTLVQTPFAAPLGLIAPAGPRLYHVCGNIEGIVGASTHYDGARRLAARSLAWGIARLQRALTYVPGTRVVTNGDELLALHGGRARGRSIVSASMHTREVGNTPRRRPIESRQRVIFVGYLRPEKGIDVLLQAVRALIDRGLDLELELVGASPAEERGVAADVADDLRWLREQGRLRFAGPRPFGPELFQALADADVLALPSRSEGTPRVLLEARACRCPVVATRVGGIPTSVDDGRDGLLVAPDDVAALSDALAAVLSRGPLRDRLIEAGLARARQHTVETMADAIVEEAHHVLEANR